ncbi:MAG: endonuclease domain-containing protein [Acidimicrobiia bacterium]
MPTYPRPQRHIERARNMRKSMTSAETYVWTLVRGKRLGWKFRRQEPIGPYIVDFVCIGRRLVVELDGDGHGGEYDDRRDEYLGRLGFRVLRFDNDDLSDPDWVEAEIRAWLEDPTRC